jgi:hypothetical protein
MSFITPMRMTGRAYFRVICRSLAANADMPMVSLRSCNRQTQHLQHSRITLVEVERHDLGIPIDTHCQLSQIVRPDREPIKHIGKGIDLDNIVGDLAHHVDLQSIDTATQPVSRHCLDHMFGFRYAATERHHDA